MLMESIEAITAELRFRRRDFDTVYSMYRQLEEKSATSNPGAVAAINGKAL